MDRSKYKVVETIVETSLGPRSTFAIYERKWWGWKDVSTFGGYELSTYKQVEDWFRIHSAGVRKIERPVPL